ncbi:hypothetical protein QP179_04550 [Sphingomonas aurantiaca]|uniref:hypothetical protein n=1 Tax=Sphingomonas aurantiaca TaxID=185949 RepID=UPI002FE28C32
MISAPIATARRSRWPDGKSIAVWVSPNLEYYEIDPPANPHRKSWTKPHPDVVGYAHRDYANRVGHWRMAEVMSKHGFPGSVSLSVALCQHIPEIVADANARGWEFFSHGIYNTRYSYGMDEAQERAIIEDLDPHRPRGDRADDPRLACARVDAYATHAGPDRRIWPHLHLRPVP